MHGGILLFYVVRIFYHVKLHVMKKFDVHFVNFTKRLSLI